MECGSEITMVDPRQKLALPINNTLTSCQRCGTNAHVKRFKRRDSDGWKVIDYCCVCGRVADTKRSFIPLVTVKDFRELEEFPSDPPVNQHACAVCGSTEKVELHHWAPFKVFGDSFSIWPASYLCHNCHLLWHHSMQKDNFDARP